MRNFRTFELAKEFHARSRRLRFDRYIRDQFQRAALSIALNLAEGRGKRTTKEQVRYFQIALGSARECQAILEIVETSDDELEAMLDRLAGSIYLLIERAR